jgi:murein endopeptidase
LRRLYRSLLAFVSVLLLWSSAATAAEPPKTSCKSIGDPGSGCLLGGITLEGSDRLQVRQHRNWGTPEMLAAIVRAVDVVHAEQPGGHTLVVGDLSRKAGGRFRPHRSHQSGRDADIGYFLKQSRCPGFMRKANRDNFDVARTWTMLWDWLSRDEVEYVFVDWRLQKQLYIHARDVAQVARTNLTRIFQYPKSRAKRVGIIRHQRGHSDHMHARFRAPASVAVGAAYAALNPHLIKPTPIFRTIRRGDTLTRLARRHKVRIKDLRKWNKLRRRHVLRPRQKLIVGWRSPRGPTQVTAP